MQEYFNIVVAICISAIHDHLAKIYDVYDATPLRCILSSQTQRIKVGPTPESLKEFTTRWSTRKSHSLCSASFKNYTSNLLGTISRKDGTTFLLSSSKLSCHVFRLDPNIEVTRLQRNLPKLIEVEVSKKPNGKIRACRSLY